MAEKGFVRRECDYCGASQDFPSQIAELTPTGEKHLQAWVTLVKVFLVRGQLHPVQKHACKDSCASNIISLGMLDLPKEIKDVLAEDQKRADEFQKKLQEKTQGLSIAELGAQPAETLPAPAGEA